MQVFTRPVFLPGLRTARIGGSRAALSLALAWVLTGCTGNEDPPVDCPDEALARTLPRTSTETGSDLVEVYCADAAGLLHGPWKVWLASQDLRRDIPIAEGRFERGTAEGPFLYRFEPLPEASTFAGAPEGLRYRQEYWHGLRHGVWEEYLPDGTQVARQEYRYGNRCGLWFRDDSSPIREESVLASCDDILPPDPGVASEAAPARGLFWDGQRCPAGTLVESPSTPSGTLRTCERNGQRDGPSLEQAGDVEVIGSWKQGRPDGTFVAFRNQVALREWTYRDGVLEGPSRRWDSEGRLLERGSYQDGLQDGKWEWFGIGGTLLEEGTYRQGRREGEWIRRSPGGSVIERTRWSGGLRDGDAATFYDDGKPECSGAYRNDLREGPWRCLHPTGALLSEVEYSAGYREGTYRSETPGGQPRAEGPYLRGVPEGPWRFYRESLMEHPDDQGLLVEEVVHRQGWKVGTSQEVWMQDRVLHARRAWRQDLLHGPFESYYHNGALWQRGAYVAGREEGPWEVFDREGHKVFDYQYREGELRGYVEYAPDGTVIAQQSW